MSCEVSGLGSRERLAVQQNMGPIGDDCKIINTFLTAIVTCIDNMVGKD